jgi:hypothetical protein
MDKHLQVQEVEVRYTVEMTHKLKVPEGKTPSEVVSEFFKAIIRWRPSTRDDSPGKRTTPLHFRRERRAYLSSLKGNVLV